MSTLGDYGASASVPTEQSDKPATPWEGVASEVLAELQPVVEGLARKAADQFYDETLYRIQDYLADNVTFNLAGRLQAADRQASHDRHRANAAEKQRDDLLAALTTLLRTAEDELVDAEHANGVRQARAAIAKASGASQ